MWKSDYCSSLDVSFLLQHVAFLLLAQPWFSLNAPSMGPESICAGWPFWELNPQNLHSLPPLIPPCISLHGTGFSSWTLWFPLGVWASFSIYGLVPCGLESRCHVELASNSAHSQASRFPAQLEWAVTHWPALISAIKNGLVKNNR